MTKSRVLTFFLTAILCVSVFSACTPTEPASQQSASAGSQSEFPASSAPSSETPAEREMVNLVVYWMGDGQVDNQKVWDKLNEMTARDIQTTVTHNLISWSNPNGLDLVLASGEYLDASYTFAEPYAKRVLQGAYMELTPQMMEQSMPNLYAKIPALAWQQASVSGKIYGIPNVSQEWSGFRALGVRSDLREKYNIPEIVSLEILEQFYSAVAKNEPGILPWDGNADFAYQMRAIMFDQQNDFMFCSQEMKVVPGYGYKINDPSGTLINAFQTQEFKDYLAKAVEWRKNGFWSANALNNDKRQDDSWLNGTSASVLENITGVEDLVRRLETSHPEMKPEFYDGANGGNFAVMQTSFLNNSFCISAGSKYADRCMEWIQYLKCNQEAYDLMKLGVEGEHWVDKEDGKFEFGPKVGDYGSYSNWWINQIDMDRKNVLELPALTAAKESYAKRTVVNPVYYFLFDQEPVSAEIAAMSNVTNEYMAGLELGMYDDWQGTLDKMEAAYEVAGREKVLAEYQKQLDAYLAALPK